MRLINEFKDVLDNIKDVTLETAIESLSDFDSTEMDKDLFIRFDSSLNTLKLILTDKFGNMKIKDIDLVWQYQLTKLILVKTYGLSKHPFKLNPKVADMWLSYLCECMGVTSNEVDIITYLGEHMAYHSKVN